eukprot:3256929-Rhodomonas_salina.1
MGAPRWNWILSKKLKCQFKTGGCAASAFTPVMKRRSRLVYYDSSVSESESLAFLVHESRRARAILARHQSAIASYSRATAQILSL